METQRKAPASDDAEDRGHKHDVQGDYTTDTIEVVGEGQPRVPDGLYRCRFLRHEVRHTAQGIPKLAIRLEIVEGEHTGLVLTAWRNLHQAGERTRIAVGRNSKTADELRRVARQRDKRLSSTRLSVAVLRDVDLEVRTRTSPGNGNPYSVADSIDGLWDATAHHTPASPVPMRPREGRGRGDGNGDSDADASNKHQQLTANRKQPTGDSHSRWVKEYTEASRGK